MLGSCRQVPNPATMPMVGRSTLVTPRIAEFSRLSPLKAVAVFFTGSTSYMESSVMNL